MSKKVIKEGLLSAATGAIALADPVSGVIASVCKDIYGEVAQTRAQRFFRKVGQALSSENGEEELLRYVEQLKNSSSFKDLLFDFTQAALRTQSELAITMLAFAYSQLITCKNKEFDEFHLDACQALPLTTDKQLNIFRILTDIQSNLLFVNRNSPVMEPSEAPRFIVDEAFQKYLEQKCPVSFEEIEQVIYKLHNRDMLNYDTAGFGGALAYTVTKTALRYRALMEQASNLLQRS